MEREEAPTTRREPVTETLHGEEIVDPYRWLEDSTDEAVTAWTSEQNEYTDRVVDSPQRDRLAEAYEEVARVTDYGGVKPAGDRYFQQITGPDEEQPVLYAFDSLDALRENEGRTLVDPNAFADNDTVSVDWFVPGPNGDVLAYGVAEGGDEQYDIVVIDAADGTHLDRVDDVGRTGEGGFGWVSGPAADDPEGFYYVATGGADDGTQLQKAVVYHELGADEDRTVESGYEPQEWPGVETDGQSLVVAVQDGWARTDLFAAEGDPETVELTPVATGMDASFGATLADNDLYLETNHDAPYRRLLAAPVSAVTGPDEPGLDPFEEVVPEGDAVIRGIAVADDTVYVHAHRDARSVVTRHDRDEPTAMAEATTVDLPTFASVEQLAGSDDGALFCNVQSFATPPSVQRVTTDAETIVSQATTPAFDIETSQEWFESADGTEVPAFVVRRAGVEPDGNRPALLTGYGGFRVNRTPSFDRFRLSFLRAGGVFVLATLRGGTEYGSQWHEQGRREHKQNVFDDAIAVAEGLVDRGWAGRDRLAVAGGSNGGLLVGALLTQRPALFRAAVCRVPLLDMLRFHRFLLGESWTSEYGSPEDPEAFEYIREYSPYHNAPETAYPATLFTTALGDTRVHPGHARKMTALLQEYNTGSNPIALRVDDDAGHGVGKPVSKIVREQSEFWGFLAQELDIDPASLV